MYKDEKALNNLQQLIWRKTQPNQKYYIRNLFTNHIYI